MTRPRSRAGDAGHDLRRAASPTARARRRMLAVLARLPGAVGAHAAASRRRPPTTRGPGSCGGGRSPTSTSSPRAARRGSRCRCCSRRRSRSSAPTPRRSCGSGSPAPGRCWRWRWPSASARRLGRRGPAGLGGRRVRRCSSCSRPTSTCATRRSATPRRCSPALALWAFERHLDGRRDHALYLGFAAALLRPEVWPFLGLYGLWLWFREPELRLRMAVARRG